MASPESLKLLFVISAYPPHAMGGMERACQRMAQALVRRGHYVTILTQAADGEPALRKEEGVAVRRVLSPIPFGPLWGITYMRQVKRWMRKLERDWHAVVCYKLYLHSVVALDVAKSLGRPCLTRPASSGARSDVWYLRSHRQGERFLSRALEQDAFLCLSNQIAGDMLGAGVPKEKIWRTRNFLRPFPEQPQLEGRQKTIVSLGRFDPNKNIPKLVEAFEAVSKEVPDANLRIIGSGSEEKLIRSEIARRRLTEKVEIISWTDNPKEELSRGRCHFAMSGAEGMSNVLIESLSCGTPAISTDVGGVRDALDPDGLLDLIVPDGEFQIGTGGLIIPIGDLESAIGAMRRMMTDDELQLKLATEARERAESSYTEQAAVEEFENALRAVIEDRSAKDQERGFAARVLTGTVT